jgi:hypothetical protein
MSRSSSKPPEATEGWEQIEVRTFEEFVTAIRELTPAGVPFGEEFWFRGQNDAKWPLETSLMRSSCKMSFTNDELIELEAVALKAFRWTAHLHVKPELLEKLKTIPCWWALMQHHRAPTRLLDWSLSPYVAAYFAVLQDGRDAWGAVWAFCSNHLREAFMQRDNREPIPDFEASGVASWYENKLEWLKHSNIVLPLSFSLASSERIAAQQGKFTMSFHINAPHDSIASQIDPRYVRKIVIPPEQKPVFLLRLRTMNITGASLFPGVDGLGMAMKELVSLGQFYKKAVCPYMHT